MSGGSGDDDSASVSAEMKQQESILAALPQDVRHALRYAQLLDRAKSEPIYLMPFDLRIR